MRILTDGRMAKGIVKQNHARMVLAREIGKSIRNETFLSIIMLCYYIENSPSISCLLESTIQEKFGKLIVKSMREKGGTCYCAGGQQFMLIVPGMRESDRVELTQLILNLAEGHVYRDKDRDKDKEIIVSYGGGGVTCAYSKKFTEDYWGMLAGMEMDICFNLMIEGLMHGGYIL